MKHFLDSEVTSVHVSEMGVAVSVLAQCFGTYDIFCPVPVGSREALLICGGKSKVERQSETEVMDCEVNEESLLY